MWGRPTPQTCACAVRGQRGQDATCVSENKPVLWAGLRGKGGQNASRFVRTSWFGDSCPELTLCLPPVMGNLSLTLLFFGEKCKVFQITLRKDRIQTSIFGDVFKPKKKYPTHIKDEKVIHIY